MKVYEIEAELERIEVRIRGLEERLLEIRQELMNPLAGIGDGMPRASGSGDRIGEGIAQMEEIRQQLERAKIFRKKLKRRLRRRKRHDTV